MSNHSKATKNGGFENLNHRRSLPERWVSVSNRAKAVGGFENLNHRDIFCCRRFSKATTTRLSKATVTRFFEAIYGGFENLNHRRSLPERWVSVSDPSKAVGGFEDLNHRDIFCCLRLSKATKTVVSRTSTTADRCLSGG